MWQECSGPNTCVIPLSPSATCFRFLRKPEQHKNQPCSAAASLLLEGLKGFHLQMCPCRRSTAGSPPCLRYRQTENAEAQGHQLCPQPVPTNGMEMQQGGRCVPRYKKITPGVKNPTQGTQPRAETTIHGSSLNSEQLMRGFTQHCRMFCSICTKALQGSKGWSQFCTLNLCQSFFQKRQHSLAGTARLPQRKGSGRILWCFSVGQNKV